MFKGYIHEFSSMMFCGMLGYFKIKALLIVTVGSCAMILRRSTSGSLQQVLCFKQGLDNRI